MEDDEPVYGISSLREFYRQWWIREHIARFLLARRFLLLRDDALNEPQPDHVVENKEDRLDVSRRLIMPKLTDMNPPWIDHENQFEEAVAMANRLALTSNAFGDVANR